MTHRTVTLMLLVLAAVAPAGAQPALESLVPISFNRYYRYDEIVSHLRAFERAYPELVSVHTIGRSLQGRELVVATVHPKKGGDDRGKPAIWIDANVHGNEIQGAETVLYTIQYLTKAYGAVADLTELMDATVFYLLPSQNPDGREYWFSHANTSSSSRSNQRPVDGDLDGRFDEDPYDDLDGDGSITTMWQEDPDGDWVRDEKDPRIFRRVEAGERGKWRRLGSEGVDNDGDGEINEDPPGGDDMNRNWPSDWQPTYVQFGAGPYPLSHPETRAIAAFILDHPNIAAVQSYHNSGGMILRGPGAEYRERVVPAGDVRVYDEMGELGAKLLPFYRYMIIYKDLYTVHGGFVNWTAEGLGIFSFTNEMWSSAKWFQRESGPGEGRGRDGDADDPYLAVDRLVFGQTFADYAPFDHPTLGKVLIGGPNRWGSRATPLFLLEEECHRNFAFTAYHADQMPRLKLERADVVAKAAGLYQLTVEVENERLMPTRSGIARANRIGAPDVVTCEPAAGRVLAGGPTERMSAPRFDATRHEANRLVHDAGVGSRGRAYFRFLVEAPAGTTVTVRYEAEKAQDRALELVLR